MTARLILITTNYPYTFTGGESMFVAPEMRRLVREFGTVHVVPQHALGERLDVPPGVEVDTTLSKALLRSRWVSYLFALAWSGFWAELWRASRRGGWVGCARVWRWTALATVTYRWAKRAFPPGTTVLFYTYWRGGSTLALARLARHRPASAVVTRVHRYELYESSFDPPFQPWHPALYQELAMTAAISQDGFDYLQRAGVPADRLLLSRLGTEPANGLTAASTDGALRIVSCSFITPVKRVQLIADALLAFARRHPNRVVHWTHFGGGPDLERIRSSLRRGAANFHPRLPGQVANQAVMAHYAHEPVDAFILLSESEGLPVSIQEAASAGIPVVATDVGGVRELVTAENGVLLGADPSVSEVVTALECLLLTANPTALSSARAASHLRWSEGFDAEHNHTRFAQRIRALIETLD